MKVETAKFDECFAAALSDDRGFIERASHHDGEFRTLALAILDALQSGAEPLAENVQALRDAADAEGQLAALKIIIDRVAGILRCPYCSQDIRVAPRFEGCSRFDVHVGCPPIQGKEPPP